MKPKIIWIILVLSVTSINLNAQEDKTLSLDDIKLSSAPAFSLLDISPSSIQKPASTKALTTSIVSNLNSGIPQNYALEITPFWFFKHPTLTSSKYFGFNAKDTTIEGNRKVIIKNLPFSRAQYFSASLAVINRDASMNVGTLGNHNISFGLRGTLLKFYKQKDLQNIYIKSVAWLNALKWAQGPRPVLPGEIDDFANKTQPAADSLRESLKALPLFSLDAAFATNIAFETNSISSNRNNRKGVWLNANLSLPLQKTTYYNYLNIYAIGRYINSKDSLNQQGKYLSANLFDYGGRFELQFDRLFFGYEYIKRSSSVDDFSSYRSVGLVEFKVSRSIFITGSFGKNFPKGKNLVTALGIYWGISSGRERIVQENNL